MTKTQIALVLAKAASFDNRTVGEADIEAWYECIGDLDFDSTMKRVTGHYRESTEWLKPAHLVPHPTADPAEIDWR